MRAEIQKSAPFKVLQKSWLLDENAYKYSVFLCPKLPPDFLFSLASLDSFPPGEAIGCCRTRGFIDSLRNAGDGVPYDYDNMEGQIMSIAENIARIRAEMNAAAIACGRDPASIQLCAATKMNGADAVREAIAGGVDCCGENRVQELTAKRQENAYAGAPVHFIGVLQTNKVKQVVGFVDLIQSVDRVNLMEAIEKEAAKKDLVQDILLEINIGAEESKSGFRPDEVFSVLEDLPKFPHLRVRGLMAIPPVSLQEGDNLKFFIEISQLSVDIERKKYDNVAMECLSMGMSDDFADAIRCGSTMIRIGTAIFGARNYANPQK